MIIQATKVNQKKSRLSLKSVEKSLKQQQNMLKWDEQNVALVRVKQKKLRPKHPKKWGPREEAQPLLRRQVLLNRHSLLAALQESLNALEALKHTLKNIKAIHQPRANRPEQHQLLWQKPPVLSGGLCFRAAKWIYDIFLVQKIWHTPSFEKMRRTWTPTQFAT